MNQDRIQQLIRFVQEEPDEPFNVYALAMEYMQEAPEKARHYFDQLLTTHANYLPTYYHAAALYAAMDNREEAKLLYQKGIELARAQQNTKTLQELKRAEQAFLEEEEEW